MNADGVEPPPGLRAHTASFAVADAGFFDAIGIRIVRGRGFTSDDLPSAEPVAIVSEALAERFWPGGNAVGQILRRPENERPFLILVAGYPEEGAVVPEIPRKSLEEITTFL